MSQNNKYDIQNISFLLHFANFKTVYNPRVFANSYNKYRDK